MIFNFTKTITEPKTIFVPNKTAAVAEIVIAFLSPIYPWSRECPLFKMINDILSDGMLSLFMKKLRSKLHLIYNIRVYIDSDITGTLTTIETTGDEKNVSKIIAGISDVLEDSIRTSLETWLPYINIKNIEITMPDYNINRVNITIDFGLSFEPDRFGTVSVSFDQFESVVNQ